MPVPRNVRRRTRVTPDEFRETVLPQIVSAWERQCLCASAGFLKLVSFDFGDYDTRPVGLADTEIVIGSIIRERFTRQGEMSHQAGDRLQRYVCPQCQAACAEHYAEYNIWMYRTCVRYDASPALAPCGYYLVGHYGFERADFEKVRDFQKAASTEQFLASLLER